MKLWRRIVAEIYGTAALAFVIFASSGSAYAVGIGFWVIIVGTGFIGGAHFNPAVTLGSIATQLYFKHYERQKLKDKTLPFLTEEVKENLWYLLAQVVGAFLGALFGELISEKAGFSIHVGADSTYLQAFFAEMIFTAHLVLVVLVSGELMDSQIASGMAIAFTVLTGILTVGTISGGCFNPTVCIAINVVRAFKVGDATTLNDSWVYIIGPLIGCAIGTILGCVFLKEKKQINKQKKFKWHPKEFGAKLLEGYIKSDNN